MAGIGVVGWPYRQSGVVATVDLERPHGGVAHEHFLPSGPFAILPMTDAADGQLRSATGASAQGERAAAVGVNHVSTAALADFDLGEIVVA